MRWWLLQKGEWAGATDIASTTFNPFISEESGDFGWNLWFADGCRCLTTTSKSIPATGFIARVSGSLLACTLGRLTTISELVPNEKIELGRRSRVSGRKNCGGGSRLTRHSLLDKKVIKTPTLFVQATYDGVLKPEMSKNMDAMLPNLTRAEVAASHWALTQKPDEVNAILQKWLESQGFGPRSLL